MKSIFKSKTFWFNVLTAVASFSGVGAGIPVVAKYAVPAAAAANIGLRLVTNQPVSVSFSKPFVS
jgi:hypothetical protein